MAWIKWIVGLLVLAVIAAALYYALPSRDVVRLVGTEVRLEAETRTAPDGSQQIFQDDVYFIKAISSDGAPRVYRNEDNGWYLKFDSSNLDAKATNLVSTRDDPQWVVVTHYGWRIPLLSMYPNATSLEPAAGPDAVPFPWLNIIVIALIVLVVLVVWRIVVILRRRHVDPLIAEVEDRFEGGRGWWRRRKHG